MMRQSSSRNQRTKGFKLKHILQVCLLIAVCVWLIYQVKHSHDKKKALEERNSMISNKLEESRPEVIKFGRKDLPKSSLDTAVLKETETHGEDEENEEAEEAKPETKQEDIEEEEGREAGDDEIDVNDKERANEEAEHRGEFGDEEEKESQLDDMDFLENQDHDGADANSQVAREENYKGDDASSAVVRDIQTLKSETENLGTGNLEDEQVENTEKKDLEIDDKANRMEDSSQANNELGVVLGEGEAQLNNNSSLNRTSVIEREPEVGSLSNSTNVEPTNDQMERQINSTVETVSNDQMEKNSKSALRNATASMQSVPDWNIMVEVTTPGEYASNSEKVVIEQSEKFNTPVETEKSDGRSNTPLALNENGDVTLGVSTNPMSKVATVIEQGKEPAMDLSA